MPDPKVLQLERDAEALRQQGQHPAAIEKISEALEIDPEFVRGHLALAVLYHLTGEFERACQHAETRASWNQATASIMRH